MHVHRHVHLREWRRATALTARAATATSSLLDDEQWWRLHSSLEELVCLLGSGRRYDHSHRASDFTFRAPSGFYPSAAFLALSLCFSLSLFLSSVCALLDHLAFARPRLA